MLNYEIEPYLLKPLAPAGTEPDSWNGRTFVSIVGFLFCNTRVLGMSIPFHQNFEEVNLRFYVRRRHNGEWRRGVVFIKEIVPRLAMATVARIVYGENYVAMPMRHSKTLAGGELERGSVLSYQWRYRGDWAGISLRVVGEPCQIAEGSEEEFITEHYWGYSTRRRRTVEYQVEHPRWHVWQTESPVLECDVGGLYGERFVPWLSREPCSAFVAEGSKVVVRRGRYLI